MTAAASPMQIDSGFRNRSGWAAASTVISLDANVFFVFGYNYAWRWYSSTRWAVS
ncbi:MAG: hypothetical protein HYX75_02525 [Acidobacteria bacterium]|nr:hypothetical protein [Acidobacteriota bacterium]